MNFLGHAYLSFGDPDILTGNMIADFVKGTKALKQFPEGIQRGIRLHRALDMFADTHPASQRAKVWFREKYGLYAGPLIDIFYDHFLATDPQQFKTEQHLLAFTQETYQQLGENEEYFPDDFAKMFPHMREYNWLYNYRTLQGMQRSLKGLEHRAQYMSSSEQAYETFVTNYYQLGQCYYEFIENAIIFVKKEMNTF